MLSSFLHVRISDVERAGLARLAKVYDCSQSEIIRRLLGPSLAMAADSLAAIDPPLADDSLAPIPPSAPIAITAGGA